jgi:myosin heavy subunit
VAGTGRFKKVRRENNAGKNDNSAEAASDLRIRFLERKVHELQCSLQQERSARQVVEEENLAKVAEVKSLTKALANARDSELVRRPRDAELAAMEAKVKEAHAIVKRLKNTATRLKKDAHERDNAAHIAGLKWRRAEGQVVSLVSAHVEVATRDDGR